MSRVFRRDAERKSLWQRIKEVALTDVGVIARGLDEDALEQLEELLLAADFGVPATLKLVDHLEALIRTARVRSPDELRAAVEARIAALLGPGAGSEERALRFAAPGQGPTVFLVVGVNGVGKTTTIGKLAHRLRRDHRVLLAAGDTFRAGAIDQLKVWADRVGAEFVSAAPGADPAAVAFDAIDAAARRAADVVIVDTAGRLHTQGDLMVELQKVHRVIARKLPDAPHETLLVLDATVGQNALAQARTFGRDLPLTGLALAKLDSTARGGIVVALQEELGLPVKLAGTGEGVDALEPFDPAAFARDVMSG
jgi:fused signal recognition particle receptor